MDSKNLRGRIRVRCFAEITMIKVALHFLKINPTLFLKRLYLEFLVRLSPVRTSQEPVWKLVKGVRFPFYFSESKNRRRMSFGLYEMGVVYSMETFLKEGDVFLDVGANIGYLSAVGMGLVGQTGEVHCFELIPQYAERIHQLSQANPGLTIKVNQVALGNADGEIPIFVSSTSMGHSTAVPGLLEDERHERTIVVPSQRLDSYLSQHNIKKVALIKIDVEGFELPVLQGLSNFFRDTSQRPPIICEVVPFCYEKLGYEFKDLFKYMERFSYAPFEVANPNKRLSKEDIAKERTINVLFKVIDL